MLFPAIIIRIASYHLILQLAIPYFLSTLHCAYLKIINIQEKIFKVLGR